MYSLEYGELRLETVRISIQFKIRLSRTLSGHRYRETPCRDLRGLVNSFGRFEA